MKFLTEMDSTLLYVGLFLFCFIIALILLKIKTSVDKMKTSLGTVKFPSSRVGCMLILLLAVSAILLLSMLSLSRDYYFYKADQAIAKIVIESKDPQKLQLTILQTPLDKKEEKIKRSIQIKKIPWAITVETLSWNKIFSKWGLRPMCRLVSITANDTISLSDQTYEKSTLLAKGWDIFSSFARRVNKLFGFASIHSLSSPKQIDLSNQTILVMISSKKLMLVRQAGTKTASESSASSNISSQKTHERIKYPVKDDEVRR